MPRQRSEGNIYHVYARGVGKCIIFEDDRDRSKFLAILDALHARFDFELLAWCLMDNHVHLLMKVDLSRLAPFMQNLESNYARYFNARHERVGHLFQDRYGSKPINDDEQYLTTVRYIHQNPKKDGLSASLRYPWSSYNEYLTGPVHIDEMALNWFESIEQFVELHAAEGDDSVDFDYCKISEARDIFSVARHALAPIPIEQVVGLERSHRNLCLRILREVPLSPRQIERLTGVSKSTVDRVTRGTLSP